MNTTSRTKKRRAAVAAVALMLATTQATANAPAMAQTAESAIVYANDVPAVAPLPEGPLHILAGPTTALDKLGTTMINSSSEFAKGPFGVVAQVLSLPLWITLTLAYTVQLFFAQGCNWIDSRGCAPSWEWNK